MIRLRRALLTFPYLCFAVLAGMADSAYAATVVSCQTPEMAESAVVEYFVSLADAAHHHVRVSIRIRDAQGPLVLNMPVWNALYQVRNFAKHVERVTAEDAGRNAIPVRNTATSEWQLSPPSPCMVVGYDVHLNEPGPFGSSVNTNHAFFNWAMVLMYAPALRSQRTTLRLLDVPSTWSVRDLHVLGSASAGNVEALTGVAANYDELVDSPAELGRLAEVRYQQDGVMYHIVVDANPADYDMRKIEDALKKITHAEVDWTKDRPFREYTFLYHFPDGPAGGGMEHAYGTAIDASAGRVRESPMSIAPVSAHEFFHLWNVKRIRPQSLEPIDYQRENDTRALWFSEGLTSAVGDLMLVRSGLVNEAEYLKRVSEEITDLQSRPAHQWQSAEESSLDAWFEGDAFYRSPERSISYYNKGEILGVLLDLRIRQATSGQKSLRDLFHYMNDHYAKQHRFFDDSKAVEQAAEQISGTSFAEFFRDYVAGVKEIPYDDFLAFVGLRAVQRSTPVASLGLTATNNIGGQPEVIEVDPGSAAQLAGIRSGMRIVAVNGSPADGELDDQVAAMKPGEEMRLRVADRKGERDVVVRLGARSAVVYELQDTPSVDQQQRTHRAAWVRGDDESGALP